MSNITTANTAQQTRLATENRSRVSIHGRPSKKFASHIVWSPCKIWLFLMPCGVRHLWGPKIWEGAMANYPLVRGRDWRHRNTSNRLRIDRGSQKFGGRWVHAPWRRWRGWPPRNMLVPHVCYRIKFRGPRSNRWPKVGVSQNFWMLGPPSPCDMGVSDP